MSKKNSKPKLKIRLNTERVPDNEDATFKVISTLGEGSFGRVFLAESYETGEEVAVKANFVNKDVEGLVRLQELQLVIQAKRHPFLLACKEICLSCPLNKTVSLPSERGRDRYRRLRLDNLYFVMKKANYNLDQFLSPRRYPEIIGEVKFIIIQILLGLEFLHARGIAHRDIKPDNILCFVNGNNFHVKIADFGLGKRLDNHLGNSTMILNKNYRAPEIACRCKYYSTSVDCWSLGVLFFRLLSGGEYFYDIRGDDDAVVLGKIHQLVDLKGINYPDCDKGMLNNVCKVSSTKTLPHVLKDKIKKDVLAQFEVPDALFEMLEGLLDPKIDRWTASQCLNSRLFSDTEYTEYIKDIRFKSKISHDGKWLGSPEVIEIDTSNFRRYGFNLAIDFFNEQKERERPDVFYTPQIWFASLDLFDRWLSWRRSEIIIEEKGETTKEEIELAYFVCLYDIVKILYMRSSFRFQEIHKKFNGNWKDKAEGIENDLVERATQGLMYRPTIYEELKEFKEELMPQLVRLTTKYLKLFNGKTWKILAECFEKIYNGAEKSEKTSSAFFEEFKSLINKD